jgi:hypothetical protein
MKKLVTKARAVYGWCEFCKDFMYDQPHRCPVLAARENRTVEFAALKKDLAAAHKRIAQLEEALYRAYNDPQGTQDGILVATIADMVFGEDAPEHSDFELLSAVRKLVEGG